MSCCGTDGADWTSATQAQRDRATALAVDFLWAATGRVLGTCQITVRPCGSKCDGGFGLGIWWGQGLAGLVGGGPFVPWLDGGEFRNDGACGCSCAGAGWGCCCEPTCQVRLPGPVESVTLVVVDGVVVSPSMYRIDDYDTLTATGPAGQVCPWPDCQDFNLAAGQPGTWSVTYQRGIPVPAAGQAAAGTLACELLKACTGTGKCALPARTSSIVRQGLTIEILDAQDLFKDGLTGIPEIDLWVVSVNPYHLKSPSTAWSPDLKPVSRRQTWP